MYLLFFSFMLGFIINTSLKLKNIQKFYLKNFILFSFSLSFAIFMIQLALFFQLSGKTVSLNNLDFFSNLLIFLVYIVGLVSLLTLGDRFWFKNNYTSLLFIYFPMVVFFMVKSVSLLQTFLYYELLLLPSIFFVYGTSYTRRSQQANTYFFVWTQIGSIISLLGVSFLLVSFGDTSFEYLSSVNFTNFERTLLYFLFFTGFGVKVPVWPFHYWLTKVHVEAPSGFSIFLSGFLVKTAVYCFYKFTLLFSLHSFFFYSRLFA